MNRPKLASTGHANRKRLEKEGEKGPNYSLFIHGPHRIER